MKLSLLLEVQKYLDILHTHYVDGSTAFDIEVYSKSTGAACNLKVEIEKLTKEMEVEVTA